MSKYNVRGKLTVNVLAARNLRVTQLVGEMDPFCSITVKSEKFKTPVAVNGHRNPTWQFAFVANLDGSEDALHIKVKNKGNVTDDLICRTDVDLPNLDLSGQPAWYSLRDPQDFTKECGELQLSATMSPEGSGLPAGSKAALTHAARTGPGVAPAPMSPVQQSPPAQQFASQPPQQTGPTSPQMQMPVQQQQPNYQQSPPPQQMQTQQPVMQQQPMYQHQQPMYQSQQPTMQQQPMMYGSQQPQMQSPVYQQPMMQSPVYGQPQQMGSPMYQQPMMQQQPMYQPPMGATFQPAPQMMVATPQVIVVQSPNQQGQSFGNGNGFNQVHNHQQQSSPMMNTLGNAMNSMASGLAGMAMSFQGLRGKFDAAGYVRLHNDVRNAGMNGWQHFAHHGYAEKREIILSNGARGQFDDAAYFTLHPDVARSGMSAWEHYMRHGHNENRDVVVRPAVEPVGHFDEAGYHALHPDVRAAGVPAKQHFTQHGYGESRRIAIRTASGAILHGRFNAEKYKQKHPDLVAAGVDGWSHFRDHGINENRMIVIDLC